MKLGDIIKIGVVIDALEDEIEDAHPGDEVHVPDIKGIRMAGRKVKLRLTLVIEE